MLSDKTAYLSSDVLIDNGRAVHNNTTWIYVAQKGSHGALPLS